MVAAQNTLWEKFLQPIFQLLVDEKTLKELHDSIDWQAEYDRLSNPNLIYPDYYSSRNFHGIKGGYLTPGAAVTYDPITQYVLPPSETWIRQELIAAINGSPQNILDLGCGTGSMTIMLQQAFPKARVTGLDLSPYMLAIANRKAKQAGLDVQWLHEPAEATQIESAQFDLITASLLFHETPPSIAQGILRESCRLLKPQGQILILDGNQKTIRHTSWLTEIFEEPYIKDYAENSVDAWMGAAGFTQIRTDDVWWLNQVTRGIKSS
ncbi:methylase involved in ubiquinone/menaquinone biosynthesis [Xenococcus sp. PCC 7305]|uniref:class I SAM-dependent methyltransferase n=1 Tax=Xenococcus sp. PCC 7305 TaxID=102125 RepID=UPI0002AC99DC|nr:methyltransferase domain-containing protein [Xenococcus sp. PCC 7305]ELS04756.1 methylase involved in ubiquinone/menaquinone biosynthesis [Xenococcus sp. PCC 7305]